MAVSMLRRKQGAWAGPGAVGHHEGRGGRGDPSVRFLLLVYREFVHALARELAAPKPYRIPAWLGRLVAPLLMADLESRIPVSNAKAKGELGWSPRFPTYREGLSDVGGRLAGGREPGMVEDQRRDRRGVGS
jgi:hypothetical protein